MKDTDILFIIRKIFDDYDEKNGAMQKIDYTQRAENIVNSWKKAMTDEQGFTTELICKLHALTCQETYIPINDEKGRIVGFSKAGEYRTINTSAPSQLYKGLRTFFSPPEQISDRMEYLVRTMNSVFASKPNQELMIENIIAFTIEFLTVHPFSNQNKRTSQVIMELLSFQTGNNPFHISYITKKYHYDFVTTINQIRIYQNVQPFYIIQKKHYISAKNEFERYKNSNQLT